MKRIKFFLVAAMLLISASGVQAQSIGDLLTGLGKTLVGDKATTAASLKGTWTYTGPACEFESDNLLSKAGGSAVSTKIENKITPVLKKYGVHGIVYTFDGNGNYTTKIKKRTIKGTYTFDSKKKTITFKPHLRQGVHRQCQHTKQPDDTRVQRRQADARAADHIKHRSKAELHSRYHQHADEELQWYALRIQTEEVKG